MKYEHIFRGNAHFPGKLSMADKMAVADALLGKHTDASKGSKPPPKPKVKPVIGKDKINFKITRKF